MQRNTLKLKSRNGRILTVGSTVRYGGQRCYIYQIEPLDSGGIGSGIGLENSRGISWDHIHPKDINCKLIS